MEKQKKKWLKIVGIVIAVLFLGFFITQYVVKSKLENTLSTKLPETLKLTYDDLHFSLLQGQVTIDNIKLTSFGKTVQKPNAELKLEHLIISGFGYWNFLVNNLIQVNDVYFKKPDISYYHNASIPEEEYQASQSNSFDKRVEIKQFKIDEGRVKVINSETDSLKLQTQNINLKIKNILYNEETKNRKLPIDFGSYSLFFDSFFAQMGDYENVTLKQASVTNKTIDLTEFKLYTKYSKETLSKIIPFQRDHYNLEIDSIVVNQPKLDVVRDSVFSFDSNKIVVYQPDFKVYRDKLVTDDLRFKPLFSRMLRDLKFDLNVENLIIQDADIEYSEKAKLNKEAGNINFGKLNADIKHVSNTYQSPTKTTIHVESQFMQHAPLKVDWSFDVNDESDLFKFQAEIDDLNASYMNQYMEPNLNIRLEGELNRTYFTISGTDNLSSIDFKVKFEEFNVTALKEDGNEENQFLSKVINIFVSKNSSNKKSAFKEATRHDIERQKTKSVFNFIWISTQAGLLKAMIIE
ncbi:hypothetical protein [Bizionia arctica]|uniref:DUF748 domain-containing protein n=1 Tax=Bizionia arctica TaxID=1495645 RepID=A0A917GFE4_9FLAO|nr:hypothetical protein [Bizionia arctica]GGG43492.1 hypothetical protein GCM10010976_13720 [Bizionia arctica]